jgi:pimeloyl-ACP methyl ester carboxylesterase
LHHPSSDENNVAQVKASRSRSRRPAIAPAVHVRRAYVDCRFGQLHLTTAFPSGGGFDELTPLVCVHHATGSGRMFAKVLPLLGRDRSVYAVDLPGFGQSDAPPTQPSIEDYAAAVGDFLDGMRLRNVDLLGYQLGSSIATEVALMRPNQVRRIVLVSAPVYTIADRESAAARTGFGPEREDGGHVSDEWRRMLDDRGPGVSVTDLTAAFAEKLRAGERAGWGQSAALGYPLSDRLAKVRQPLVVFRPMDDCWDQTARTRNFLPPARIVDLPDFGVGVFAAAAVDIGAHIAEFLDTDG